MIERLTKPYSEAEIFKELDEDVKEWFINKYGKFSPPQRYSVKLISKNKNILISSPTGTGKTLSAFLGIINRLVKEAKRGTLENKVYSIYISPLRALGNDIMKNLDGPLREIEDLLEKKGIPFQDIRHATRTGDTSPYQKQKMNRLAPHILITTPESLALALCSPKFKEKIANIESVVIDEIHALADNKRGTHLSLSLERLENFSQNNFTRIGLSATISPLEEIAHYLIGNKDRKCKIVDVSYIKKRDLKVIAPEKDPLRTSARDSHAALYDNITEIIDENRTTLIFTNTRSGTESVVLNLKRIYQNKWPDVEEEIVTHHSSLSRDRRLEVEESLKSGKARVVVSSTSLELGIDIGSVDVVIQIGSPKSIARCLQRVGRAGHNLTSITKGYFLCPDYDDLLEVAVMLKKSYEHVVDSIIIPNNCLDVLSQHVVGLSLEQKWNVDDAYNLVKKSYCYKDLTKEDFVSTLTFLAGSEDLAKAKVYGKIWFDREGNMFGKRGRLAKLIYMSNIGTIPDETKITVAMDKQKIGYIEEGFLEKLKKGDIFSLGGRSYKFRSVSGMRIKVDAAFNQQPTVPQWFSEQLPLSFDLAEEIRICKANMIKMLLEGKDKKLIINEIKKMPVDAKAAKIIYEYINDQYVYMKKLAGEFNYDKDTLLVEYYNSSREGFKIIFHTLYGRRVNDGLSRIIAYLISKKIKKNIAISVTDNNFMLHMPKSIFFDPKIIQGIDVEKVLREAVEKTEILKRRFRHVASRGLMILKRYKGYQKTVGRQQMTATTLLNIVKKEDKFPLLEEAYREILEDYLDLKSLKGVVAGITDSNIIKMETSVPSPFAHNLILSGMGDV
ncbi:MAG TPA: hypothetical protein DEP20_01220, partial [Fusobacteria bacterium]|nr:hypothetical protein [Fusobacteriota bacterium]